MRYIKISILVMTSVLIFGGILTYMIFMKEEILDDDQKIKFIRDL